MIGHVPGRLVTSRDYCRSRPWMIGHVPRDDKSRPWMIGHVPVAQTLSTVSRIGEQIADATQGPQGLLTGGDSVQFAHDAQQ